MTLRTAIRTARTIHGILGFFDHSTHHIRMTKAEATRVLEPWLDETDEFEPGQWVNPETGSTVASLDDGNLLIG